MSGRGSGSGSGIAKRFKDPAQKKNTLNVFILLTRKVEASRESFSNQMAPCLFSPLRWI